MFRPFCLLLCLGWAACGWTAQTVRLENDQLAIELDGQSGGLRQIVDKRSGSTYAVDDRSFRIEVGSGSVPGSLGFLTPQRCRLVAVDASPKMARYRFVSEPFTLTLSWRLDGGDGFAVKQIGIEYAGEGPFNVRRFEMFDWAFEPRPAKAIPYYGFLKPSVTQRIDDGEQPLVSDTSTACFYRYAAGGLFSALSCDFVDMREASGRMQSVYWPGYIVDAGNTFSSEAGIVGVYQRKGLFHPPYEPSSRLNDFHLPNIDTRLDRGEIEAMSAAVARFIKPGVYRTMVNGWGVGLPWLIESDEAVLEYKQAIDTLTAIPSIEALHFVDSWCGLSREFRDQGLALLAEPNREAIEVFRYARENGIGLSMFVGISNNYPMHKEGASLKASTELLSLDAEGHRRPNNIAISRGYTDFAFHTVSAVCQKYPVIGLSYDFLGIQPDYDTAHGYLPGRSSLLPQYANVRDLNRRLRARFPELMLRGQVGWMWFGPWLGENMSLCHNAHDHNAARQRNFLDCHTDHHFANNIRLSNWFTNNCKMHPRHKMNSNSIHNGSAVRAWDYGAWRYSILSQIATGDVFGMLHNLPDEAAGEVLRKEDVEFFDHWIEWQKAHRDYYLKENDLFGEPRPTGLDGYAYGNGHDSVVFVCNPTFQTQPAAVPIDGETHLPRGGTFRVRELFPEWRYHAGPSDGVFPFGSSLVVDVPPQSVMVFELTPDQDDEPLLLGAEGRLTVAAAKDSAGGAAGIYQLSALCGPSGTERAIAIRLADGMGTTPRLMLDDKPLAARRAGRLLLARVRFTGEAIDPEVRQWKAVRDGDRLKITARLDVPALARQVLDAQKLPISRTYNTAEWLNKAAWLGWGRMVVHVPIAPNGYDVDNLRGTRVEEMMAATQPRARLNGKPLDVCSNMMGGNNGARWSGFFVDATGKAEFGKPNTLELDLYATSEDRCFGLYMPNFTPQMSSAVEPMDPPSAVRLVPAPEAADGVPPVPMIEQQGNRLTVWLRLGLTARSTAFWNPAELAVEGGQIVEQAVLGADPRWTIPPAAAERGEILLGSKPKEVLLHVEGTGETFIRLDGQPGGAGFTLAEIVGAWKARGDRFDSYAATIAWPNKKATVTVDVIRPWDHKQRVSFEQ